MWLKFQEYFLTQNLVTDILRILWETILMWMSQYFISDEETLVQVMALCHSANR